MRREALFSTALIASFLFASGAFAQDAQPTPAPAVTPAGDPTANAALATELFNAGRDLMNAGNYAAACPKLVESARLDAKVGTLARLAECEEKSNHIAASRGRWQQALNLARAQNDSRVDHVKSEFERVDKITPKIHFRADGTPPADLTIKVDAFTIGIGAIDIPLPVDPGHHVITASAAGRTPWSGTVDTVADGVTAEVLIPQLAIDPSKPANPAQPYANEKPGADSPSTTPWPTIGLVTGGVGVLAVAIGVGFAVQAKGKNDDSLQQGCIADNCNVQGANIRNEARAAGNRSTGFVLVGSLLMAAGLGIYLFAPKPAPKAKATTTGWASSRFSPDLGPQGGSLTLSGVW